jgi:hypothetical protein
VVGGGRAHAGSSSAANFSGPNKSSTAQPKAAANAKAAATDGTKRRPSIALTAVREMPALAAKSACDKCRSSRRVFRRFPGIDLVMILSWIWWNHAAGNVDPRRGAADSTFMSG